LIWGFSLSWIVELLRANNSLNVRVAAEDARLITVGAIEAPVRNGRKPCKMLAM
jgi:hypothetical protein